MPIQANSQEVLLIPAKASGFSGLKLDQRLGWPEKSSGNLVLGEVITLFNHYKFMKVAEKNHRY